MTPPETRYARSSDLRIAYQVGLRFENRGLHALRGLPDNMHLYTVLRSA